MQIRQMWCARYYESCGFRLGRNIVIVKFYPNGRVAQLLTVSPNKLRVGESRHARSILLFGLPFKRLTSPPCYYGELCLWLGAKDDSFVYSL